MKIFPVIKITDHIMLGISPDKKEKKEKSGCGFLGYCMIFTLIMSPFAMIKSCLSPDDTHTSEPSSAYEEYISDNTSETTEEKTKTEQQNASAAP